MTGHDQIKELLGVFALDAIDDDERRLVEAHLGICATCHGEVDQHHEVAAVLALAGEPASGTIWDRVEREIRRIPSDDEVAPLRARRLEWLTAVAAIVVLVVLVTLQTVRLQAATMDLEGSTTQLAAIETALAGGDLSAVVELASSAPDSSVVALTGQAGGSEAIILPDGTGIMTRWSLAPLGADATYQLWAIVDGEVISAGLLGPHPGTVAFHIDPERLEGLVVTAEAAGGVAASEQQPAAAWFRDA